MDNLAIEKLNDIIDRIRRNKNISKWKRERLINDIITLIDYVIMINNR